MSPVMLQQVCKQWYRHWNFLTLWPLELQLLGLTISQILPTPIHSELNYLCNRKGSQESHAKFICI